MKILALSNLYPPDFLGGYELVCSQVTDALLAAGHDVRVLTSAPRQPVPPVSHVDRLLKLGARFNSHLTSPVFHHLEEAESNFVHAYNVHSLTTVLDKFNPDVVFLWNLTGLGGLALLACLHHLRVPWVWYLGDCVPNNLCRNREIVVPMLAREFERQVRGEYLVVSQQLVDEIRSLGIRLNGHIELVPGWIRGERPEARTDFFKRGQLRIVSAGYLSRHKGTHLIIEAAGRLRDLGYNNFVVDLYGNVSDSSFQNLIQVLKLEGRVVLRGLRNQSELAAIFGQYDVFAFPTWEREPFGLAPLEAAAQGCVPVVTRRCGFAEWLVDGVHCLKAERTAEAFAQVFRNILDGKIDLEPLGRRASAVAWRDFHLDVFLPRIERALERAARQPRSGAGTADEAYRMALLAEKLTQTLIQEAACA